MTTTFSCFDYLLGISSGAVVGIAVAMVALGCAIGLLIYRFVARRMVGSVKQECNRIREEGRQDAKSYLKEAKVEAKDEQQRLRSEFEKECKERRNEINRTEQRLAQREDFLSKKESAIDHKSDVLDDKKRQLEEKEKKLDNLEEEIQNAHSRMIEEIEKVAQMTQAEAKDVLMNELLEEARRDAAVEAKEIEQKAKEEADKKAKNIVAMAIQRCSADHASEFAVSVVELPSEDMKGRLIGRVGRNIRAIENATGVDLIIDDTPDVVTLSGFDPVRREVARLTIERLVSDGRIHPARIEET
ncbi:MAG: Rnase Y domain-containing protein, partial [Christensenellales bacterium]